MKDQMSGYLARFDALTVRERVLILVTVLAAILLPVVTYVVEPTQKAELKMTANIAKMKASNAEKYLDIQIVKTKRQSDPNADFRVKIEQRKQRLAILNQRLKERASALVSANDMLGMLQIVLANHPGVSILSASKRPPVVFDIDPGPASIGTKDGERVKASTGVNGLVQSDGQGSGIYRHDFSLVIEGGFFDVLSYLQALESLPQGFFWDALDYQVTEYPKAEVKIEVHTLSTEQRWLGV